LNYVRKPLAMAALTLVAALALAACGSSSKKSNSSGAGKAGATGAGLDLSIAETGKTAKYTLPKTVTGGLQTLTLANKGKKPHGAQLVRLEGNHTPQEALKQIASQSNKTPSWLRAEGGLGPVPPGKTADATLMLKPGKYVVFDPPQGPSGPSGAPAYSQLTVAGGAGGALPNTPTTITAANPGKDKYRWDVSGQLTTGLQNVTFVSKGKDALHLIGAFRLKGNPSQAEILKALGSNGPPPKFIDQSSFFSTAILDGGKSDTTSLNLPKPGTYVLFCPLADREGGKSHDQEGLITKVQVG
jgi:hypothetical protein